MNPINSIIRKATRDKNKPLNILTAPTHEAYQTGLSLTNNNFYLLQHNSFKPWSSEYRKLPENHHLVSELPMWVDFDLVLSQNKFGQYQILSQFAKKLQLPLISLEHTLPVPSWSNPQREELASMRGDTNVFISEYSIDEWGFDYNDPAVKVVEHMIDTSVFESLPIQRKNICLSVVNDWINRDWCCGFNLWTQVVNLQQKNQLPIRVLGNTPGLSKPASNINELITAYQTSKIFLNTSLISPVPTALLEAMSCGCACVSTATCMIPDIIENGVNGFISNNPKELQQYCLELLENGELASCIGVNARKTIEERFNVDKFVKGWNNIFYDTANKGIS